ncbi:MAG TPA: hypothetical protein VI298_12060 [Geobacteraceae bacterium]
MATAACIYSFDVFDTVLTRNVLYPKDVFHLVQQRIPARLPDAGLCLGKCFWGERVWSEFMARRKTAREDITVTEIYAALAHACALDDNLRNGLMELELEVESEVLVPVDGAAALLASCRSEDIGVVFVSDMYLPASFLQDVLERAGLFLPGDRLYVSGELGRTKGSGNLFRYLLNDLGIAPGQLVHCGDHLRSDVLVPRSLGIRLLDNGAAANGTRALFVSLAAKVSYAVELVKARRRISEAKNVR